MLYILQQYINMFYMYVLLYYTTNTHSNVTVIVYNIYLHQVYELVPLFGYLYKFSNIQSSGGWHLKG